MKNKKLDCEINFNGKDTTLTFDTTVWYANGNHYDYPDDNYDDKDYEYEISLDDFTDDFWDDFAVDEDFNYAEWIKTATEADINELLNKFEGNIDEVKDYIQEKAQDDYDEECDDARAEAEADARAEAQEARWEAELERCGY